MNNYRTKTDAELLFIIQDAGTAAVNMKLMGNSAAEAKYLDQINDASSELYRRRTGRSKADSVSYHTLTLAEVLKAGGAA